VYNYSIPIFCQQGGDKFHIILQDICPLEMESFVAVFQFRETEQVHLKQTNLFTYTGITPSKFSFALLIVMLIYSSKWMYFVECLWTGYLFQLI